MNQQGGKRGKFKVFFYYWELIIISTNIRVIRTRSMRWANAVVRTREIRNTYRIFVLKPKSTRQIWRTEHKRTALFEASYRIRNFPCVHCNHLTRPVFKFCKTLPIYRPGNITINFVN